MRYRLTYFLPVSNITHEIFVKAYMCCCQMTSTKLTLKVVATGNQIPSSSSYICHGVGPLVDPFQSESDIVTRNLCILLKILGLCVAVSCACDKILLFSIAFYVVRTVFKFDFTWQAYSDRWDDRDLSWPDLYFVCKISPDIRDLIYAAKVKAILVSRS
jgi:hypothetical protein